MQAFWISSNIARPREKLDKYGLFKQDTSLYSDPLLHAAVIAEAVGLLATAAVCSQQAQATLLQTVRFLAVCKPRGTKNNGTIFQLNGTVLLHVQVRHVPLRIRKLKRPAASLLESWWLCDQRTPMQIDGALQRQLHSLQGGDDGDVSGITHERTIWMVALWSKFGWQNTLGQHSW